MSQQRKRRIAIEKPKMGIPVRTEWDDMGAAIAHLRSHLESLECWFPDMSVDFTIVITRKGKKD
jgi:hypothetical protein